MNDHRNHRYRASEPAWPTGDDPDFAAREPARREQPQERTGFWSPLWDDDDDDVPVGNRGRSNGHSNGRSNGRAATQWPTESDARAAGSHHRQPPPRPAPRSDSAPAWPSQEPPPAGPPPGRNGMPTGARPPAGPPPRIARPRPGGPPRHGLAGSSIPDGPTELLPPVASRTGPEPELLTHREPDYDEELNDDPDLDEGFYDEDEDGPLTDEQRKKRRKKIWRRIRRTMYTFIALMIILPIVGFFIAYQIVEVPAPEASGPQSVTLQFKNGTQMAKLVPPGGENRTMVKYDDIPKHVLHAVYAAEDADFESNPGFDITGVLRAAWNQATGGEGGGSTITQQYIKKATGKDEQSLTRKALEIVKAYKMNNTYTKEQIIEAYLNTVYFGRSAYGIAAAAQAYYGRPLEEISPSEAALLAGMIQSPGRYKDEPYMQKRWNFVMDQMVDKRWLSAADRKAAQFPKPTVPLEQARPKGITGPRAHIQRAVFEELERDAGLSEDEIYKRGLTIRTTIEDPIQKKAEAAVREVLDGEPTDVLRTALVAVNPKNGEVLAYYGGEDGVGYDWASVRQEPGSSFKPFDLVALLQQGKGLGETYDGSNNRTFPGRESPVRNSEGTSCGKQCTVKEAMRRSINTVFYDMALQLGTQKVADAAEDAGITSPLEGENGGPPDGNISIGGGTTQVTTYEMASAYATFAAQGTYRKPHLVTEVLGPEGGVFWKPDQASLAGTRAFDKGNEENNKKIARNVTEALEPVLDYSDLDCADGRECAGKTGTHQFGETEDNAKAWMVGYTPQVSTAVSMAAQGPAPEYKQLPLKNARGKIIYGGGLPGEIWKEFMDSYLDGAPKEGFGKYKPVGKDAPKKSSSSQRPPDQSQKPPTESSDPPTESSDPPTDTSEPEEPTDPGPTIIPTFPNNGRGNDPPDGS